jgi:hypothetical protein
VDTDWNIWAEYRRGAGHVGLTTGRTTFTEDFYLLVATYFISSSLKHICLIYLAKHIRIQPQNQEKRKVRYVRTHYVHK